MQAVRRPSYGKISQGLDAAATCIEAAEEFMVACGEDIGEKGAGARFIRWLAREFRNGSFCYVRAQDYPEPDEHPEDAPETPPHEERAQR